VLALALITTWLINRGRAHYAWVTLLPMVFVTSTTLTAGAQLVGIQFPAMIVAGQTAKGVLNIALTVFVIACVAMLLLIAVSRWLSHMIELRTSRAGSPSSKVEGPGD
jgi:carbon starvation protein